MIKITSTMILTFITVLGMILTIPSDITVNDIIFLSIIALILLIILSPIVLQYISFKKDKENNNGKY